MVSLINRVYGHYPTYAKKEEIDKIIAKVITKATIFNFNEITPGKITNVYTIQGNQTDALISAGLYIGLKHSQIMIDK